MSWTEQRKERAKKLWTDGLSASQIATDLGGVSRNAVIGALHRMGLTNKDRRARPAPVRRAPSAPRPRRVPSPHGNSSREKISVQGKGQIRILDNTSEPFECREADVVPLHIGIMALDDTTCRYPFGDGTADAPFSFCGHPPKPGSPYCAGHAAICEVAPPSQRVLTEEQREALRQRAKFNFRKRATADA